MVLNGNLKQETSYDPNCLEFSFKILTSLSDSIEKIKLKKNIFSVGKILVFYQ